MFKRKIILIFFLGFSTQLYSQSDTLNRIDVNGKKFGFWKIYGRDFQGKGYANDSLFEEGRYLDGKKIGIWKTNYPNGKRKSEIEYKNGRPNGKFCTYYESGCIQESGTFLNNRYVGEFKSYWENGTLKQEKFYNDAGKTEGKVIYRYVNGQIEMEFNVVNGIEVGDLKRYYPNGDIKEERHYDGTKEDPSKRKDYKMKNPDVYLKKFETDCNGKINETKNQKPKTSDENEYRNGKIWKGRQYIYDENGLLIKIELYENGKKTGEGLLIGNDPVIDTTRKQNIINDNSDCGGPCKTCDGYSKIYDNHKRLCKDGEFKNGKLWNGKWYKYSKEGLILKVEIYKNGKYFADGQMD